MPDVLRRATGVLCAFAMLLSLSACDSEAAPDHAPRAAQDLADEAASQQSKWHNMRVEHYNVTYLLVEGPNGTPAAYRKVIVRNGAVLDTTCPDGPCPSKHLRDLRLVPELFKLIRPEAGACTVSVVYHVDFHFPSIINRTCDGTGSDRIVVVNFSTFPS
jgi:hypothetical protein